MSRKRAESDEHYVLDLCDEVLGTTCRRQWRFDDLRGDRGQNGRQAKLPVDGYYPDHRLIVEYMEIQHTKPVPFFDKPDRKTISGMSRGEQRKRYDGLRQAYCRDKGIALAVMPHDAFELKRAKLLRNRERDLEVIKGLIDAARQLCDDLPD